MAETFVWALIVVLLKFLTYCYILCCFLLSTPTVAVNLFHKSDPYYKPWITSLASSILATKYFQFCLSYSFWYFWSCFPSYIQLHWHFQSDSIRASVPLPMQQTSSFLPKTHRFHANGYSTYVLLATFLHKKSSFWIFLSRTTRTSARSFLCSLCDRLTLELHGELNTVISSLMQLIYYIKVLLHSQLFHAEILSLFWHFAENMYVFRS